MRPGSYDNPSGTITATLRRFMQRHSDKIDVAQTFGDDDGVWIVLRPGWCDPHGAHTIRGDSATDAMRRFLDRVRLEASS